MRRRARRRRRSPGASSRTGSPRAGPRTRTARSARSTGGRPSWSSSARSRSARSSPRFAGRLAAPVIFGVYVVALVLLLATDLDQRLLPDVITLPVIPHRVPRQPARAQPARPAGGLPIAAVVAILVPGWAVAARDPVRARARSGRATSSCWCRWGCSPGRCGCSTGVVYGALLAGDRDRRAAGAPADHAQDVHPVRAVPDPRRALGDARPALALPVLGRPAFQPVAEPVTWNSPRSNWPDRGMDGTPGVPGEGCQRGLERREIQRRRHARETGLTPSSPSRILSNRRATKPV